MACSSFTYEDWATNLGVVYDTLVVEFRTDIQVQGPTPLFLYFVSRGIL